MTAVAFFANKLIAPNKPNPEKLTSYECGEEPTGSAWLPFNARFYVIALIFLLFDVEMVFIFPWATVFADHRITKVYPLWSKFTLVEMGAFVGILFLGLIYVWVKGDLDWIKPQPVTPQVDTNIPLSLYDKLNLEQSAYRVKPFEAEMAKPEPQAMPVAEIPASAPIRKPMFKPTFKKPADDTRNE